MSSRSKLPEYWIPKDLKAVLIKNAEPYAGMTEKSKEYLETLQILKKTEKMELSENHYLQLLKLGLYLEEFQYFGEMRKFNLYGKRVERNMFDWREYRIWISDLDKDHPVYNKTCSYVELINARDMTKRKYVLRAKNVTDDHLTLMAYPDFLESYRPDNVYNVRFRLNPHSFRCMHYALSLIDANEMSSFLFPAKKDDVIAAKPSDKEHWFNQAIAENPEQKQAVLNIMQKSSFPAPYILYGPPGTGKTATLVETICQIYHNTKENVLVCAPSNAAADVITKRLLNYIPFTELDRLYGRSRDCSLIDDVLKTCSNYSDGKIVRINQTTVSAKRIIVSTVCTCTRLTFMNLSTTYSYVFIDEAGQSTEPESLMAFNIIKRYGAPKCQIVISGDPKQLGPCVKSKFAVPILGQSILERLMKLEPYAKHNNNEYDPRYITKLLRNYRSHPAIIQVSNELYYDNELIACSGESPFVNEDFPAEFPIIFHGVHGTEEKELNSKNHSSYNVAEIVEVLNYVRKFIGERIGSSKVISQSDIGIVTPFALQSKRLRVALNQNNFNDVTVGTVEIFQGQEKEVIIMSAVRSRTFVHDDREHIGFLSNPRRFNVGITRAKAVLVVIGHPEVLKMDVNWRHFMKFCQVNGACRGAAFELEKDNDSGVEDLDSPRCEASSDLFEEAFKMLCISEFYPANNVHTPRMS